MPGGGHLLVPAAPPSDFSSDDEERPLQAAGSGTSFGTQFTVSYRITEDQQMSIKPSVFMHLFYLPEMARMNCGTFMTVNAFMLFALTIVLQVGLTVIAGLHVLHAHQDWKSTILLNLPETNQSVDALTMDMPQKLTFGELTFGKYYTDRESSQCCGSVICSHTSRSCCKRGDGTGGHEFPNEHAFLSFDAQHIASSGKPHKMSKGGGGDQMDDVSALCQHLGGGKYTCADPMVRYMARWDELDANNDGVWSQAEAVEDQVNLGCRLRISQEDMFRSACRSVELDIRDGIEYRGINRVVPKFIEERKEVPKSFFYWYSGLVALCSSVSQVQCSSLVMRGVFDKALNPEYGSSVGLGDLDSVMDYCDRLLQPGGLCSQMMPSTYLVYGSLAADKCGEASLTMGPVFRNPYDKLDSIRLLLAEFATVATFKLISSPSFEFFLFLVVMLWFFNLMNETKESIAVLDFLLSVKVSNIPLSKHSSSGKKRHVMSCITRPHQSILACMVMIRLTLLAYMSIVGTIFLASNHGFIELLCNAVALGFIFELDELVYMFLVSTEVKKQLEIMEPVHFSSKMPKTGCTRFLLRRELWGFVALPLLALSVVLWHRLWNVQPIYKALTCLCQKNVDSCMDLDRFRASWWDGYWANQAVLSQ